jgi:predicted nucleic acid-binding protein
MILVDTGAWVALLDQADLHHEWAVKCFKILKPPLFTCDAVLAETWHLLGRAPQSRKVLGAMHRDGIFRSDFAFEDHTPAIWRLLEKYSDVPMDFADACLVRLSEIHAKSLVWTTDSDFNIYRRHGRQVVPVMAPWQMPTEIH